MIMIWVCAVKGCVRYSTPNLIKAYYLMAGQPIMKCFKSDINNGKLFDVI